MAQIAGKDGEQQKLSFTVGGHAKGYSHFWRQGGSFLQNETYAYHMIEQSITLLHIHPKELKTYINIKIYTKMFIATLLIISKTWKQPRCPLIVNKPWYIQTTVLFGNKKE